MGSHSCFVQTKNPRLVQAVYILQTSVTQNGPGSSFFLLIGSAPVLFCIQKDQCEFLHIHYTQHKGAPKQCWMKTEQTSKLKQRTKPQRHLKLRLMSEVYCCLSPSLTVSYRETKRKGSTFLFLHINRERKEV